MEAFKAPGSGCKIDSNFPVNKCNIERRERRKINKYIQYTYIYTCVFFGRQMSGAFYIDPLVKIGLNFWRREREKELHDYAK